MPLRIALFTDDTLFSEVLLRVLREEPGFDVAACDKDVPSATAEVHVALVDGRMNGALALCESLSARGPSVILVGAPEEDQWACKALTAGAGGILTKTSHVDDVVKAIHVVYNGGVWAQRRWLVSWARELTAEEFLVPDSPSLDALLSRREREVFHGAATGAGNKELADRFSISEATVKAHMTRIFQKLGVSGRAELAAAYHGLARRSTRRPSPNQHRSPSEQLRVPIPPSAN